jgi:tetratricopeptide (TPR) repeat protein
MRAALIHIAVFLIFFSSVKGQVNSVYMRQQVANTKNDSGHVIALIELSYTLAREDSMTSAINSALTALDLAKKTNSATLPIKVKLQLGMNYVNIGKNQEAIKCFDEVEKNPGIFSPDDLASAYYSKGSAFGGLGNYPQALKYFLKSLETLERSGDIRNVGVIQNSIGTLYSTMGDFERARQYYFKSLEPKIKEGDDRSVGLGYNNIGETFRNSGQPDSAIYYYKKGFALGQKENDPYLLSTSYSNMGAIYSIKNELERSLDCFQKSLVFDTEAGEEFGVTSGKIDIGGIYTRMGKFKEAQQYLDEAMKMSAAANSPDNLKRSYEAMSALYEAKGEMGKALFYHKKFKQINDSIFNGENTRQFNDLRTQYEVDQKEAELKQKAIEEEVKHREEIKRHRVVNYAVSCGGILVLALFGISYRSYRQKKKANEIIMKQKELVENKNKEVMDSINYAKRIQNSLFPTEKYITRQLNRTQAQSMPTNNK